MTLITTVNLNFMILFFIYCKSRVMPLVMAGSRVCLHFYSTCISVRRVLGFSDTKACTNVSGKYERSSYITGKACVLSPSQFLPLPPSRPPPHPPFAIFLLPLLVPNPPSSLVSLSSSFSLSPSSSYGLILYSSWICLLSLFCFVYIFFFRTSVSLHPERSLELFLNRLLNLGRNVSNVCRSRKF